LTKKAGDRHKTDMTLKSVYHLQAYWKEFKRASNSATTLLIVDTANKLYEENVGVGNIDCRFQTLLL
jgi:hypothetical protein